MSDKPLDCVGFRSDAQPIGKHYFIHLERQPDGSLMDWGRHGPEGKRNPTSAKVYTGEAAEVMRLVIESMNRRNAND